MAGLGRRTHYRKHLTDHVLFDLPEPNRSERIAKVVGTRGSNQFDVQIAKKYRGAENHHQLAILPTKFRKLVWVKRNDFVIVQTVDEGKEEQAEEDKPAAGTNTTTTTTTVTTTRTSSSSSSSFDSTDAGGGGIRYMITHILYKDQVRHLQSKGLWPTDDPDFAITPDTAPAAGVVTRNEEKGNNTNKEEGRELQEECGHVVDDDADKEDEVEDDYVDDNDPLLFVNTNRVAKVALEDSSSSSSEEVE